MAGLAGSDKTVMTEEGVLGDRTRGNSCGLTDASNLARESDSPSNRWSRFGGRSDEDSRQNE